MELSNVDRIVSSMNSGDVVVINDVSVSPYIVTKKQEMRLDMVSFDKYEDVKYVTELAYINGITNVFSIKENDVILVIDENNISNVFNFSASMINEMREAIKKVNEKKKSKLDMSRLDNKKNRNQTEKDKKMPPNILNNDKITIENGRMILRTNF